VDEDDAAADVLVVLRLLAGVLIIIVVHLLVSNADDAEEDTDLRHAAELAAELRNEYADLVKRCIVMTRQ